MTREREKEYVIHSSWNMSQTILHVITSIYTDYDCTRSKLELSMYSFHGDRQCISVTRMKGSSKLMASITLNFVLINLYVTSNGFTVVTEIAKLCVHVHTDQLNSYVYMYTYVLPGASCGRLTCSWYCIYVYLHIAWIHVYIHGH